MVNITDKTEKTFGIVNFSDRLEDDSEVDAEEQKIQAAYMGMVCNVLYSKDGELLFYNREKLLPIVDRVEEGYVRYFIRGKGSDKYIVIKDGFELIACILPLKFLSKEYISELQDYQLACMDQFEREEEREKQRQEEQIEGQQTIPETEQEDDSTAHKAEE